MIFRLVGSLALAAVMIGGYFMVHHESAPSETPSVAPVQQDSSSDAYKNLKF